MQRRPHIPLGGLGVHGTADARTFHVRQPAFATRIGDRHGDGRLARGGVEFGLTGGRAPSFRSRTRRRCRAATARTSMSRAAQKATSDCSAQCREASGLAADDAFHPGLVAPTCLPAIRNPQKSARNAYIRESGCPPVRQDWIRCDRDSRHSTLMFRLSQHAGINAAPTVRAADRAVLIELT